MIEAHPLIINFVCSCRQGGDTVCCECSVLRISLSFFVLYLPD